MGGGENTDAENNDGNLCVNLYHPTAHYWYSLWCMNITVVGTPKGIKIEDGDLIFSSQDSNGNEFFNTTGGTDSSYMLIQDNRDFLIYDSTSSPTALYTCGITDSENTGITRLNNICNYNTNDCKCIVS